MKKKILSILLVIVLMAGMLVGLTACGDDDKDEKEEVSSSPEAAVEDIIKAIDQKKAKKILDAIDIYGMTVLEDMDEDEYEDFYDEYKDFLKSDEYDDMQDEWDEAEEEALDGLQDWLDGIEDLKVKVKKITKNEEIGKNIYEVKAKIEATQDDDTETDTMTFYVMKDGSSYKVIGGDLIDSLYWYF